MELFLRSQFLFRIFTRMFPNRDKSIPARTKNMMQTLAGMPEYLSMKNG